MSVNINNNKRTGEKFCGCGMNKGGGAGVKGICSAKRAKD